jgi:probable rRNA maturation factor
MTDRPASSPTTTAAAPEASSPGASGTGAQADGATAPDAETNTDSSTGGPPRQPDAVAGDGGLDVAVLIQDEAWTTDLPAADALAERATRAAWDGLPGRARPAAPAGAEASVVLADDATVQALNRDYRGQDKPTNVLSFANLEDARAPDLPDGEPVLLGDVVLARETVLAEAQAQAKTAGDHLSHLCVHGLLHLMGYDHMAEAEAETMEALERRVLAGLGIADPYAAAPASDAPAEARAGGRS